MSSEIKVDTISENTSANGIAIDGLTLKDGNVGAAGTATSLAGIPFYNGDTTSIYTHDVSGTDSTTQNNAAYGLTALDAITTGDDNVAIGYGALSALTTGSDNVAIGSFALDATESADFNTAVGYNAGTAVTTGGGNVHVGYAAGASRTEGGDSVFIGYRAGHGCTTGADIVFIGKNAGDGHDTEGNNLGIGTNSLGGSIAGGEYNVGVGNNTLDAVTSGDNNVSVGYNAGTNVTTGVQNSFCGDAAGANVTEGSGNVCVGKDTGNAGSTPLTTGDNNVFVGNAVAGTDATHSNAIGIGHNFTVVGDRFSFGKQSNVVTNTFTSDANFSRSSDERLKTNITDVNWKALDFINELRPITFNWKDSKDVPKDMEEYDPNTNHMDTTTVIDGLIAQEVKTAIDTHGITNFSGWKTDHKGTQTLSKEAFIIPLIKAVQELTAKVKALEEA